MSDKIDVSVRIEPRPDDGEPPVVYCLPSDPRDLVLMILQSYTIEEIVTVHDGLAYSLAKVLEACSGPSSPRDIN